MIVCSWNTQPLDAGAQLRRHKCRPCLHTPHLPLWHGGGSWGGAHSLVRWLAAYRAQRPCAARADHTAAACPSTPTPEISRHFAWHRAAWHYSSKNPDRAGIFDGNTHPTTTPLPVPPCDPPGMVRPRSGGPAQRLRPVVDGSNGEFRVCFGLATRFTARLTCRVKRPRGVRHEGVPTSIRQSKRATVLIPVAVCRSVRGTLCMIPLDI